MFERMRNRKAEAGINRHFRWEALFMVALFVVPILWAIAMAFLLPLLYSWRGMR